MCQIVVKMVTVACHFSLYSSGTVCDGGLISPMRLVRRANDCKVEVRNLVHLVFFGVHFSNALYALCPIIAS